jgi:lipid-A-disaccharide synthase
MISCGEASGDLYGGALVAALRQQDPGVRAFGFGGPKLREAGADLIGDYRRFAVTGLVEALSVLPRSWQMLRALGEAARRQKPDVFVAIDFPDFNFRLLPVMKRLGIPVAYYVSPQLWAWRSGRLETIRRYVSRMLVIFPFETEMYERAGVPVEFVGHPLIELAAAGQPRAAFLRRLGLDPERPVVAILPGSRPNELAQTLPTLAEAARLIARDRPGTQFVLARAPSLDDGLFSPMEALRTAGVPSAIVQDATDDVLAAADVAAVTSGTATVQTALHGCPMIIVYRLAPLTAALARRFIHVSTYGMVNLVAGRPIVPELIQDGFTAGRVREEIVSLLADPARTERMRRDLAEVRVRLGGTGASARAAAAILRVGSP